MYINMDNLPFRDIHNIYIYIKYIQQRFPAPRRLQVFAPSQVVEAFGQLGLGHWKKE